MTVLNDAKRIHEEPRAVVNEVGAALFLTMMHKEGGTRKDSKSSSKASLIVSLGGDAMEPRPLFAPDGHTADLPRDFHRDPSPSAPQTERKRDGIQDGDVDLCVRSDDDLSIDGDSGASPTTRFDGILEDFGLDLWVYTRSGGLYGAVATVGAVLRKSPPTAIKVSLAEFDIP